MLNDSEKSACRALIDLALSEDTQDIGDLTCQAVIPDDMQGGADFVSRAEGALAGLPVVAMLTQAQSDVSFEPLMNDGDTLRPGDKLGSLRGSMAQILLIERTALNFLQRLSGIATLTQQYVTVVQRLAAQILDTRKTTPGWRRLEKYAVRCGGGRNHRLGLYDGVMLKDNHLAALARDGKGTITEAVRLVREKYGRTVPVEVEIDTLDQLDEALICGPDVVLLDNMPPDDLREAVRRRDDLAPRVQLEASGGISLATVAAVAEAGVDRISIGALTHSATALDIGLDYHV